MCVFWWCNRAAGQDQLHHCMGEGQPTDVGPVLNLSKHIHIVRCVVRVCPRLTAFDANFFKMLLFEKLAFEERQQLNRLLLRQINRLVVELAKKRNYGLPSNRSVYLKHTVHYAL